MKKAAREKGEMRTHYDFRGGVRGKYATRYAEGTNVVVLDPDVAKMFPNRDMVNETLRAVGRVVQIRERRRVRPNKAAPQGRSGQTRGVAFWPRRVSTGVRRCEDTVKALLVRVGADRSPGGGSWNGPVDGKSGDFAYVAIPETSSVQIGMEKPYSTLAPELARFGVDLPAHLRLQHMHLDPDFQHLTYGDQGERAKQLRNNLQANDTVVFYAALADVRGAAALVYAIIGLFVVQDFVLAADIPARDRDSNAHSRRVLRPGAQDLVVRGRPGKSGRLDRCLPIGEYRDRAYRVRRDLIDEWGGLSVKEGYVQRSARLPRFLDAPRFLRWMERQRRTLIQANN